MEKYTEEISFDNFKKIDLRTATITKVDDIPKADKLYRLEVDVGKEKRVICAGLKKHYKKEELIGKQVIIIANLTPRIMCGIKSEGMLLAAVSEDHKSITLISPEKPIANGESVE